MISDASGSVPGNDSPATRAVKRTLLCMQREAWEQGICAQAFLESGDTETALLLAHDSVVRQGEDGRLSASHRDTTVTDPAAAGEAVLLAAEITGEVLYREAAQKMASWLIDSPYRSERGALYHFQDLREIWVDSLAMAPPFLALAGYPSEAVEQIDLLRDALWDPEQRLFRSKWSDESKRFPEKGFWGTGNGWAAVGLVRVIAALPASMDAERNRLTGYLDELLERCVEMLPSGGLYFNMMEDPSSFVEVNASQMIAHAIYRGIRDGIVGAHYAQSADVMRSAALARVDDRGFVRGVCGAPSFDKPGVSPEGQAFHILMEASRQQMEPVS